VFYLQYMHRELSRRKTRTLLTVLGLAVGIGLVVAITSLSTGLDRAQARVLNPLGSVGTDLLVARQIDTPQAGQAAPVVAGPAGSAPAPAGISAEDYQAVINENQQSALTDLSKLGNPGDHFVHDFFLPANQLTFPTERANDIARLPGVAAVAPGLTLLGTHQEGTVPQIVAEIQTGGETFNVDERIEAPTAAEQASINACLQASGAVPSPGPGGKPGPIRLDPETLQKCFPERFRRFRKSFTTPQRTIRQALNPPQTDITSEAYAIAGVDVSVRGIGLITPAQVTKGRFFSAESGDTKEAILSEAYAERKKLALGSSFSLNGTTFQVIGLATPPLGGQAADVYLTLAELQRLSGRSDRANLLLVRAANASNVDRLIHDIEAAFPGAKVTSARETARQISGSLVDAAHLTSRLGLLLAVIVLAAAFLTASLLTLSSVARRVRELGTLKAIGWWQGLVVRQVVLESLAQAAAGGLLGVAIGLIAAAAVAALAPPLQASAPPLAGPSASLFGMGQVTHSAVTARIPLEAPVDLAIVLLAVGLALAGAWWLAPPAH
jgi:ABC-type antimicrobial peptide transport system permease subunit